MGKISSPLELKLIALDLDNNEYKMEAEGIKFWSIYLMAIFKVPWYWLFTLNTSYAQYADSRREYTN